MTNLVYNNELNGIELYFDSKPAQNIINSLKQNNFRWSGFKSCWYAKQSEKTITEANKYIAQQEQPEETSIKTESKQIKKENKILSLWDLTTWKKIEVNSHQPVKEIAAEIRKHVKSRFTMCKFSVTSDYNSISFYITASPYEKDSQYLKAIEDYCTNLLKAYNYCTCYDPYGDYGSSYNFYGSYAKISYDYIQTEQTEEIKADMKDFDYKKAEFEKAEEERKEKEYQEQQKQREEDHKKYLIRQEEEKKEIELINNSVNVIELSEDKQYFVIGSQFANLNKNQTLNQYIEEVKNNDYELQNVKITKEVHFNNEEALKYFSNSLLTDFDFLAGTGGSFTDDKRFTSMTDYQNMTEEERETIIFNLCGVAIYYNSKLQFVVDAQGFSYTRYVGLVDNVKIQKNDPVKQFVNNTEIEELKDKAELLTDISADIIQELDIVKTWDSENWKEYKELMKKQFKKYNFKLTKQIIQQLPEDSEKLKTAMYKLLTEVDGIQDQFKNANLQPGQKVTLFYIGDWGSIINSKITLDKVDYTKYAQYNNAVKLTYTPQGKRKQYYNYWYRDILVYNGWLDLPEEVLNTIEQTGSGITLTKSIYMSCDKKQYDEILEYFAAGGIKPIVNTYKPVF
jgi:hypothetical protein